MRKAFLSCWQMTSWQITFVLLVNLGLFPYSPKIDPMVFVILHNGYFCHFVSKKFWFSQQLYDCEKHIHQSFQIYSQAKKDTLTINSILLKLGTLNLEIISLFICLNGPRSQIQLWVDTWLVSASSQSWHVCKPPSCGMGKGPGRIPCQGQIRERSYRQFYPNTT